MPTSDAFALFLITSIIIIAIPGPSVVFAVGRTLALGRSAGLVTVIANAIGTSVWVIFAAFGLASLLAFAPGLLTFIKLAGAIYLAYLGLQTIRGARQEHANISSAIEVAKSNSQIFREGFLVGLSNPKVAVFFTAVLPQFINPDGDFIFQFLLLGLIFEVLGVVGDSLWVIGAARVRTWILSSDTRLVKIIMVGGALIIAVAGWLLFETIGTNPK